jgi:hypothetical protein
MQKWKDRAVMMRTIRRLALALEDMSTDILALEFEPETQEHDEERIDKSFRRMYGELAHLIESTDLNQSEQCPYTFGTIQCTMQKGHGGMHEGSILQWMAHEEKL